MAPSTCCSADNRTAETIYASLHGHTSGKAVSLLALFDKLNLFMPHSCHHIEAYPGATTQGHLVLPVLAKTTSTTVKNTLLLNDYFRTPKQNSRHKAKRAFEDTFTALPTVDPNQTGKCPRRCPQLGRHSQPQPGRTGSRMSCTRNCSKFPLASQLRSGGPLNRNGTWYMLLRRQPNC